MFHLLFEKFSTTREQVHGQASSDMHMQCSGTRETLSWSTFLAPSANRAIRAYHIPVNQKQVLPPPRARRQQSQTGSVVRAYPLLCLAPMLRERGRSTQHIHPCRPCCRSAFTCNFSLKKRRNQKSSASDRRRDQSSHSEGISIMSTRLLSPGFPPPTPFLGQEEDTPCAWSQELTLARAAKRP